MQFNLSAVFLGRLGRHSVRKVKETGPSLSLLSRRACILWSNWTTIGKRIGRLSDVEIFGKSYSYCSGFQPLADLEFFLDTQYIFISFATRFWLFAILIDRVIATVL